MVVFSAGRLERHQERMLSKLLARAVGAEVEMKEVRACGSFDEETKD